MFLDSEDLEAPSTLEVALDGTLWLGDLRSQTLLTIAPDGTVTSRIHSLTGTPPPSASTDPMP